MECEWLANYLYGVGVQSIRKGSAASACNKAQGVQLRPGKIEKNA